MASRSKAISPAVPDAPAGGRSQEYAASFARRSRTCTCQYVAGPMPGSVRARLLASKSSVHVLRREHVRRGVPRRVQQPHVGAVGHCRPAEDDADPPRALLQVQDVIRRSRVEVEGPPGTLAERPTAFVRLIRFCYPITVLGSTSTAPSRSEVPPCPDAGLRWCTEGDEHRGTVAGVPPGSTDGLASAPRGPTEHAQGLSEGHPTGG